MMDDEGLRREQPLKDWVEVKRGVRDEADNWLTKATMTNEVDFVTEERGKEEYGAMQIEGSGIYGDGGDGNMTTKWGNGGQKE